MYSFLVSVFLLSPLPVLKRFFVCFRLYAKIYENMATYHAYIRVVKSGSESLVNWIEEDKIGMLWKGKLNF